MASNFTIPDPHKFTPYATGLDGDHRTGKASLVPSLGGDPSGATGGRVANDFAWGGYSSTAYVDEEGNLVNDQFANGRAADEARYQGMAAAAAKRDAYKNQYGAANAWNAAGTEMRGAQSDAAAMYRDAAYGRNSQAQALGQQMLAQGAQMQQAAALSTRGGAMAQAAALRRQQAGQGAYMQQGNAQLQALQAQEMAAGRAGYTSALGAQRAGDAQSQTLNQQQAIAQMQNEIQQRDLNQQAEQGYEDMAYDVNKAAQDANLGAQEADLGVYQTKASTEASEKARDMRLVGAGVSAVGTMGGSVMRSDVRSKGGIRPLGFAGATLVRGGY